MGNKSKKLKDIEFLIESSRMLNSSLKLDEVLTVIIKIVKNALDVEAVSLLFLDDEKKNLIVELARGRRDKVVRGMLIPLNEGIAGWVAAHKKPLIINNVNKDRRYSRELEKKMGLKTRSSICIPLMRRGRMIGVLEGVNRRNKSHFTIKDLQVFEALGDHVAAAVDNARLYSQVKKRNLESRLLQQVMSALGRSLSLDETLDKILTALGKIVKYDAAAIFVLDKKEGMMESVACRSYDIAGEEKLRLKLDEGLVGWANENKASIIVGNCKLDSRYVDARPRTCSEMVTPILIRNKVGGLLNVENDDLNAYNQEDLRLLETFAAQAAVTIERAKLYEEHREKRAIQRELKLARTIQEFFSPRRDKRAGSFIITGLNYPGRTVSGDYYDFFPLKNGSMAFAIADVAGKGVPASLIMSSFRASIHAAAITLVGARDIALAANRILCETVRPQDFVTGFIGVLSPETGEVTYCNAGHNPPILMAPDGSHRFLEIGGPVLGVFEKPLLHEGRFKIDDQVLFCYTDGLTEAADSGDEEFGQERVLHSLDEYLKLPARSICRSIHSKLLEFTGTTDLMDDVTFLVIKKSTG